MKIEKQIDKSFIVEPRDFLLTEPLELDCGRSLKNVNIRYEVAGELNEDKSNAILVTHARSGDAHVCGWHSENDAKPNKSKISTSHFRNKADRECTQYTTGKKQKSHTSVSPRSKPGVYAVHDRKKAAACSAPAETAYFMSASIIFCACFL